MLIRAICGNDKQWHDLIKKSWVHFGDTKLIIKKTYKKGGKK